MKIGRRACLAAAAALPFARAAHARGRTRLGGRIRLHVPWSISTIDPHALDDAGGALLGDALFDTLYARDERGEIVPQLAETEPVAQGDALRVPLRADLESAYGRAVGAREAAASLARARTGGARAWLAAFPPPKIDDGALVFAGKDAGALMRALASPLAAIVPGGFNPARPDGTGPLRATRRGDAWVLARNANAARGAAFLDEIEIVSAGALDVSLRAFETRADDVGWLGAGYFDARPGAVAWDCGAVGWALLRTGRDAGPTWDAPGVAQSICDAIPPDSLSALRLGPAWTPSGARPWGGGTCDLLVRDDHAWLVELARSVAGSLSTASSPVTPRPIAPPDFGQRRAARAFTLMIDLARPLSHGAAGAFAALATADDAAAAVALVRNPPRMSDYSARALARTSRVGVIGEVRAEGFRVPDLVLPVSSGAFGIDWGAARRV